MLGLDEVAGKGKKELLELGLIEMKNDRNRFSLMTNWLLHNKLANKKLIINQIIYIFLFLRFSMSMY